MRGIVDGWDAFELWVTQLAFPFQVVLVIVVLLPLCAVVATLVDRATERFDTPSADRTGTGRTDPGRADADPTDPGRTDAGRTDPAPRGGVS